MPAILGAPASRRRSRPGRPLAQVPDQAFATEADRD